MRVLILSVYAIFLAVVFYFLLSCRYIGEVEKSEGDCQTVYYKDFDRDRYSDGVTSCSAEPGFFSASELISTFGDCNDSDPLVYPGSTTGDIICN